MRISLRWMTASTLRSVAAMSGVVLLLALSACSNDEQTTNSLAAGASRTDEADIKSAAGREQDFARIARGARVFEANCAVCHGAQAQGAVNWRVRDADARFPPPPLNGTGHAWHHPLAALRYVIKNGSPGGQGNMPAWKDKLSDEQIDDVIAWFQSRWPDEVYQAWAENDRRSRSRQ